MPNSGIGLNKSLTIALVAGEASGDNLGAPLLKAIRAHHPDARFIGIGGPAMIREGLECWTDIDRLSVNGFVDPVLRLPELFRIIRHTRSNILDADVDCFVGVDFNVFNLLLERLLKRKGVRTVHYVSPTVWAWRGWRIRGIKKSVDLMMALYPFETQVYEDNGVGVEFVGHPKADEIHPEDGITGKAGARARLGLGGSDTVVAVLPGSRGSEVKYSGPDFLLAAGEIARQVPGVKFVIPAANERRRVQIDALVSDMGAGLDVRVFDGESTAVMQASDVVLVNSGTATLEAMLLKKPMVMSYRVGAMTYAIVSRLVTTRWFALPNILAGRELVPEFIQADATPSALAAAVVKYLQNPEQSALLAEFDRIHHLLRRDAGEQAAKAVLSVCEGAH
jgi:lipid-A-disaccharide synthase